MEKLKEVFDLCGVDFKTNRRSFILRDCPECGRSKYSVWMFRPDDTSTARTGGCCWICGHRYSTYSYLIAAGNEPQMVSAFLQMNADSADTNAENWQLPDFKPTEADLQPTGHEYQDITIPEHYIKVWQYDSHPAAKYARRRGIVGALANQAYVDPRSNAVAFPITADNKIIGFQRRFVEPGTGMKVHTDGGLNRERAFIRMGAESLPILVVEGPFDAVAAAWFGFHGVSTMGASITKTQAQTLAMMAIQQDATYPHIGICLDNDEAGEAGSRFLARALDAYGVGFTKYAPLPGFKDLNEVLMEGTGVALDEQAEYLEIKGMVQPDHAWSWTTQHLKSLKISDSVNYTWEDFRKQKQREAEQRKGKYMAYAHHAPEKYDQIMARMEQVRRERDEKRQKKMEIPSLEE